MGGGDGRDVRMDGEGGEALGGHTREFPRSRRSHHPIEQLDTSSRSWGRATNRLQGRQCLNRQSSSSQTSSTTSS